MASRKFVIFATDPKDMSLWFDHKDLLHRLFIEENKTLKQVKEIMESQFEFPEMTLSKYEVALRDHLKLRKNKKGSDWRVIGRQVEKRKLEGKETEVLIDNVPVDTKRLKKRVRTERAKGAELALRAASPSLPDGFQIRTPPRNPSPLPLISLKIGSSVIEIAGVFPLRPLGLQRMELLLDREMVLPGIVERIKAFGGGSDFLVERLRVKGWSHFELLQNSPVNRFSLEFRNLWQPAGPPVETPPEDTAVSSNLAIFQLLDRLCFFVSNQAYGQLVEVGSHKVFHHENLAELGDFIPMLDCIGRATANMTLLEAFFALKVPTALAVWVGLIECTIKFKHAEAFSALFELGVKVNYNNEIVTDGDLLSIAVWVGGDIGARIANQLLSSGVSPDTWLHPLLEQASNSKKLWSPLQLAAYNMDNQMIELLIKFGADPSFQTHPVIPAHSYRSLLSIVREAPQSTAESTRLCLQTLLEAGMPVDVSTRAQEDRRGEVLCGMGETTGWCPAHGHAYMTDIMWFAQLNNDRLIYEMCIRYSNRARHLITPSGILEAAEDGVASLRQYVNTRTTTPAVNDDPSSATIGTMAQQQQQQQQYLLESALYNAISFHLPQAAENLILFGVDPNAKSLATFARKNCAGVEDMAFNPSNEFCWNPLARAAQRQDLELLRLLLDLGANINDGDPLTAALIGIERTSRHHVTVAFGPVTDARTDDDKRRLRVEIVRLLFEKGLDMQEFTRQRILMTLAPKVGRLGPDIKPDIELCDVLWSLGYPVNVEEEGVDLLHEVLHHGGALDAVKFLVGHGVEVHNKPSGEFGRTLLQEAVRSSSPDRLAIVDFLMQQGADCTIEGLESFTILQSIFDWEDKFSETRSQENLALFQTLLERGASAGVWKYESTAEQPGEPRWRSRRAPGMMIPRAPVLVSLIQAGAECSLISRTIEAGADPNDAGWIDLPPLVVAASLGRLDLVEELLAVPSASVDVRRDRLGETTCGTPLQAACNPRKGGISLEIVEYLVKKGADINAPADHGNNGKYTALQGAAFHGSLTVACYLLDQGADVNAPSGHDENMLMRRGFFYLSTLDIAAYHGRMDMVQLLMDAGGRSGYPGHTGMDGAIELARRAHYFGVVKVLEELGQKLGVGSENPPSNFYLDVPRFRPTPSYY